MISSADFSPCRTWRYSLRRTWDEELEAIRGPVMFVGLNPSTADETINDPTVRRCINFARDWGYGGLRMTNIFAFRATDPKVMKAADDPVGPQNNWHLRRHAEESRCIVAAWGTHGTHRARDAQVTKLLAEVRSFTVLGLTAAGHPKHPLYLKKTSKPLNPLTLEVRDDLVHAPALVG